MSEAPACEATTQLKAEQAAFGRHVRHLRKARGLTQEQLGEKSGLAADTIRRLEYGDFSPSLRTVSKLIGALGLRMSTLFEGFELGRWDGSRELVTLIAGREPAVVELVVGVVRALLEGLDAEDGDEGDSL